MIMFKKPMIIKKIKLEIVSVYKGAKYNDTCISEIRFVEPTMIPQ